MTLIELVKDMLYTHPPGQANKFLLFQDYRKKPVLAKALIIIGPLFAKKLDRD